MQHGSAKRYGNIPLKKYVSVWYIFDLVFFVNRQRPRNNWTLKFNNFFFSLIHDTT